MSKAFSSVVPPPPRFSRCLLVFSAPSPCRFSLPCKSLLMASDAAKKLSPCRAITLRFALLAGVMDLQRPGVLSCACQLAERQWHRWGCPEHVLVQFASVAQFCRTVAMGLTCRMWQDNLMGTQQFPTRCAASDMTFIWFLFQTSNIGFESPSGLKSKAQAP